MCKNVKDKTKKIASMVGVVGLSLALGGVTGALMFPNTVQVPVVVEKSVMVEKNITVKVPVEVERIVEVPVEKIVEVDNGNLDKVMDWVQDEVDEDVSVDYILFESNAQIEAEALIHNKMIKWLKEEDYFEDGELLENYRSSEVSIKKISDAEILSRDFEDKDIELRYEVKVRAKEDGEDREYFDFEVIIPFEDGEVSEEDISFTQI